METLMNAIVKTEYLKHQDQQVKLLVALVRYQELLPLNKCSNLHNYGLFFSLCY
ncbi:hypothetical protein Hanom_Chr07g00600721 [Helianthus anomalus]